MMNVLPYESVVHIHAFFHAHASDRGLTSVGYSKGVELGHRRIFFIYTPFADRCSRAPSCEFAEAPWVRQTVSLVSHIYHCTLLLVVMQVMSLISLWRAGNPPLAQDSV